MAKAPINFTADASLTKIVECTPKIGTGKYEASIQISGDFGGGTVTLFASMNGGTDKVAIKDSSGSAYSTTTADIFDFDIMASGSDSQKTIIYATLAEATDPDLNIIVSDNA